MEQFRKDKFNWHPQPKRSLTAQEQMAEEVAYLHFQARGDLWKESLSAFQYGFRYALQYKLTS